MALERGLSAQYLGSCPATAFPLPILGRLSCYSEWLLAADLERQRRLAPFWSAFAMLTNKVITIAIIAYRIVVSVLMVALH